ncbi:MAG: helix-turn-helix transcriptional regulator [Acetatifactor sp.]|nr:helix-turn-helix transcriptional regulator [Acetatifactor sp.]
MKKYERIRNLREDSDLTQMELGKLLHISQRAYSHYEAGTRDIPIEVLIGLADIYKVNVDYLLHRTDVKEMLPVSDIKQ